LTRSALGASARAMAARPSTAATARQKDGLAGWVTVDDTGEAPTGCVDDPVAEYVAGISSQGGVRSLGVLGGVAIASQDRCNAWPTSAPSAASERSRRVARMAIRRENHRNVQWTDWPQAYGRPCRDSRIPCYEGSVRNPPAPPVKNGLRRMLARTPRGCLARPTFPMREPNSGWCHLDEDHTADAR
jgi:hypothetical protein